MNCPKCDSDQWKMASVVYDEGTTSTSSVGVGAGASGSGPGAGVGFTTGRNVTALAEKAKPPELKATGSFFSHPCLFGVALFFGIALLGNTFVGSGGESFSHSPFLSVIFKVIPFILGCFFLLGWVFVPHATDADQKRHLKELEKYQKTKVCLRCGNFYQDNQAAQ